MHWEPFRWRGTAPAILAHRAKQVQCFRFDYVRQLVYIWYTIVARIYAVASKPIPVRLRPVVVAYIDELDRIG